MGVCVCLCVLTKLGVYPVLYHSESLERALKRYKSRSDQGFRRGEIARTTYKMGFFYHELGNHDDLAATYLNEAEDARKELLGDEYYPAVGEASFDLLVSIRAR